MTMHGKLKTERVKTGSKKGEYYWNLTLRLFGKDIQIISCWPESYKRKIDCTKNAELVLMNKWSIDE